jgi:hypothetical protein
MGFRLQRLWPTDMAVDSLPTDWICEVVECQMSMWLHKVSCNSCNKSNHEKSPTKIKLINDTWTVSTAHVLRLPCVYTNFFSRKRARFKRLFRWAKAAPLVWWLRYRKDNEEFGYKSRWEKRIFSFLQSFHTGSGDRPALSSMWKNGSCSEVKWYKLKAEH